ncbi:MAG: hypothetical protein Q8O32_00395 [bacterium]|nr:hypothetical protein [bacterium]
MSASKANLEIAGQELTLYFNLRHDISGGKRKCKYCGKQNGVKEYMEVQSMELDGAELASSDPVWQQAFNRLNQVLQSNICCCSACYFGHLSAMNKRAEFEGIELDF